MGIRAEEKAAFDTAKAELSAGIAGVQKALGVLRDYYQGGAAFMQNSAQFEAPNTATTIKHFFDFLGSFLVF